MTNEEMIDRLQEYFLKQDPSVVARMTANLLLDIIRFLTIEILTEDQAENLIYRSRYNATQVYNVLNDENYSDSLKLKNLSTE